MSKKPRLDLSTEDNSVEDPNTDNYGELCDSSNDFRVDSHEVHSIKDERPSTETLVFYDEHHRPPSEQKLQEHSVVKGHTGVEDVQSPNAGSQCTSTSEQIANEYDVDNLSLDQNLHNSPQCYGTKRHITNNFQNCNQPTNIGDITANNVEIKIGNPADNAASSPVTRCYMSNVSNVTLSFGEGRKMERMEQKQKGCLSDDTLSDRINKLGAVFVEVQAVEKAKKLLKMYGHVTFCGAPGDGKTSIALMLCEAYRRTNYKTIFVEYVDDFDVDTIIKHKGNLLIVFDDIFGCVTFSFNLEKRHKLFRALIDVMQNKAWGRTFQDDPHSQQKVHVVFTSRTYNLNEGCGHLSVFNVNLFRGETIIDLTKEGLTPEEKVQIILSFLHWNKESDMSNPDIEKVTKLGNTLFGFPFICKLYFTTPRFWKGSVEFFIHPLTYLRDELDLIVREGSGRSAALIFLVLCGGQLDLVSFQLNKDDDNRTESAFQAVKEIVTVCTRTDIRREINNFSGTYCKTEQQMASFSHPSIYDAAACALGKLNIILLLQFCTFRFLFERVSMSNRGTLNCSPEPDNVSNMIYIDKALLSVVVKRLVDGIRQRIFSMTVNHPMMKNTRTSSKVLTEITNMLPDLITEKDRETNRCFLYWASQSESYAFFEKALRIASEVLQQTTKASLMSVNSSNRMVGDLQDTLVACVESGKIAFLKEVVALLQRINMFNVDLKTKEEKSLLMVASERCHLNVFNFLLQKGADATITGKDDRICLHFACESGSDDITKVLLDKFPQMVNKPDNTGITSALICAMMGHANLLEFLVSKGADIRILDVCDRNCFYLACSEGRLSVVKQILSMQDKAVFDINQQSTNLNLTPILLAAEGGHFDVYNLLVSEGAELSPINTDNRDCLGLACKGGNMSIVKDILSRNTFDINRRDVFNKTPVMIAAAAGHNDVYNLLVSEGADLTPGDDCLHCACCGGSLSIVKHLLSLKCFDINRRNGSDEIPVMLAANGGHSDVFKLLVSEGADLTLVDRLERDCLFSGCNGGSVSIVKHLVSLEMFDVNKRELHGLTPVMAAAEAGHYDIFELLVSEGADLSLIDKDNRDLLLSACVGGNTSIVKHLISLKQFDVNKRGGYIDQTPLMMTVENGHYDVYDLLVAAGANM